MTQVRDSYASCASSLCPFRLYKKGNPFSSLISRRESSSSRVRPASWCRESVNHVALYERWIVRAPPSLVLCMPEKDRDSERPLFGNGEIAGESKGWYQRERKQKMVPRPCKLQRNNRAKTSFGACFVNAQRRWWSDLMLCGRNGTSRPLLEFICYSSPQYRLVVYSKGSISNGAGSLDFKNLLPRRPCSKVSCSIVQWLHTFSIHITDDDFVTKIKQDGRNLMEANART